MTTTTERDARRAIMRQVEQEDWSVEQDNGSQTLWIMCTANGWMRPAAQTIARTIHGEPERERARADLIAKAPVLLRTLKGLTEALEVADVDHIFRDESMSAHALIDALEGAS